MTASHNEHPFPELKFFSVKTDYDEADGSYGETIFRCLRCVAQELPGLHGPITLVEADHVQVMVPGTLWEVTELAGVLHIA